MWDFQQRGGEFGRSGFGHTGNQCCHFWRYIAKSAILDIELAIRIWAWRWIANRRKSAISSLIIGDFGEILKNLAILAISKLSKLKISKFLVNDW